MSPEWVSGIQVLKLLPDASQGVRSQNWVYMLGSPNYDINLQIITQLFQHPSIYIHSKDSKPFKNINCKYLFLSYRGCYALSSVYHVSNYTIPFITESGKVENKAWVQVLGEEVLVQPKPWYFPWKLLLYKRILAPSSEEGPCLKTWKMNLHKISLGSYLLTLESRQSEARKMSLSHAVQRDIWREKDQVFYSRAGAAKPSEIDFFFFWWWWWSSINIDRVN